MIERYFTDNLILRDIYDSVEWKKVDVKIEDFQTEEVIYEGHNLEFPEHYSQQACDIIASKYFYRNIDGEGTPETSLRQVIHRMVRFWVEALIDEGVIDGMWIDDENYNFDQSIEENCYNFFINEAEELYDELVYTLLNQMWSPNSPQWFNTGIAYYGIKGDPDDFWYSDENGNHKSLDRYTRSQTSACFIIPVTDHLIGKNSITDHFVTETKLFKGGSGVGTNFSPLRAEGEKLSSGGQSSGVMSFLLGLDRNAGAIKSGGTTRRAAKMVILDVDHPDIEEFINWKVHEEYKAQALIYMGYEGGMNGEAYQTVSGQNSNNSVRVNKTFMDKVLGKVGDPLYKLKGRKDESKNRWVHAKDLWEQICTAAWKCADPGIQFDDTYNKWHTAPNAGRINATNPCSEFAFIDNSACNLASINLLKFFDGFMKWEDYSRMVFLCQLVLEASIYWGHFPTEEIAENSYKYRPTGLGITNLGALFLKMGLAYDSDKARKLAADICARMTALSYLTSSKIAEKTSCCEGFFANSSEFLNVLEMHRDNAEADELTTAYEFFNRAIKNIRKHGVRNMQTTVIAPTGTISLAMDCASTGIEPFFSHKMYKKCSDGSVMEINNPLVDDYLFIHTYCMKEALDYFNKYGTFLRCAHLSYDEIEILKTANEISPIAHVKMMATMQPYISGSISKTVNLPYDATVEDVMDIYELAYNLGLKSISIYRDGSKGTQPLNKTLDEDNDIKALEIDIDKKEESVNEDKNSLISEKLPYYSFLYDFETPIDKPFKVFAELKEGQELYLKRDGICVESYSSSSLNMDNSLLLVEDTVKTEPTRTKPEGVRKSRTHAAKLGSVELYITVSYYSDGSLCEVFVSSDREGTTTKGLLSSLSKAISHMLQYGIEPEKIAQMLRNQQYEPAGHVERNPYIKMADSISDLIARVIEFECGDYTRCHIKPEEEKEEIKSTFLYEPETVEKEEPEHIKNAQAMIDGLYDGITGEDDEKKETTLELLDKSKEKLYQNLAEMDSEYKLSKPYSSMNDFNYSGSECPICGAETRIVNNFEYCDNCDYSQRIEPQNYTGERCPACGSERMIPNGTCSLCLDCGSTTGCS